MMAHSWKKRLLAVLLVGIMLLMVACEAAEKKPKIKPQDPLWSEYISAHTAGLISKKSNIRVRFVNDIVDASRIGQPADSYISIDPPIKGSVTFSDAREIVVVPDEDLTSGKYYVVKVKADKIPDLPKELTDYEFSVQVIRQEFEVKVTGIGPNPLGEDEMLIKGTVVTADVEDAASIEKIVSATYLRNDLSFGWEHNVDGKHHEFSLAAVKRQKDKELVTLSWNGRSIDVDTKGSVSIEIPAKDVFKVIDVKPVQGAQQYIAVHFSETVSSRQNLKGLVRTSAQGYTTRIEGNMIKIYPGRRFVGNVEVTLDPGIRSERGARLDEAFSRTVSFTSQKPQVRFAGKGVILPENDVISIPFEAVNINSVQVTAFRVYENNIGQFLQSNKLDGDSEMGRVGRYLWRKTIYLSSADPDQWNRYSLDATQLLKENPGGLFRLTLSINRGNSMYSCSDEDNLVPVKKEDPLKNYEDLYVSEHSSWEYAEEYYGEGEYSYRWRDRDNPCKDAYYRYGDNVNDSRNFLASNIGLLAKRGQRGQMSVVATNLRTSETMKGVNISFMNFQNQLLDRATTDVNGFADAQVDATPFYLVAEKDGQKGYLKLSAGTALPVSQFDVGGDKVSEGIKGHIYGERGVWRPGDNIYLTFVLQDKDDVIPANHPVTMKLYNPQGQLIERVTNSRPVGDFYTFTLKTDDNAPTGNWMAKAQLGGSVFTKTIRVETVMPNRLKVELDMGKDVLYRADMPVSGTVFGQWLHGATASNLKTDVTVRLRSVPTKFERNADYIFDDPARDFSSEPQTLFEGTLDNKGYAAFTRELWPGDDAPGALSASFVTRVFEQSGAFSSSRTSMLFYPYENFVGIKLPKGDRTRGMLLTDTVHQASIATVNAKGEPVDLDRVQVTLYKINWKWWWDKSGDSLAQYASAHHSSVIKQGIISTKDGQGTWDFEVKYPSWGRYLVRACDLAGNHCTGKVVYIDWPGWAGRAQEESGAGANMLSFFSDKTKYTAGETATITLPEATQGRALVSVENGSRVLEQKWIEFKKGETRFELPLTREMSPNVYVSVTLIQPHQDKGNDRPIRLYGVIPLLVEDSKTILKPSLKAADEWAPKSSVSIEVSEEQGRKMTYTVAVVDEGLLGLTAFRTPNLHKAFYKKEALGVGTWDLFDFVAGAYGGELERLLALGGDEDAGAADEGREKKRFPPVVKFLGPFRLEAGKTNEHEFDLPHYVGAVRVMVVAGQNAAYGSTDKSVYVREPLTMLATMPRVIGPEEELAVPVSLFVMQENIKDVKLTIEPDEHFEVIGSNTVDLKFTEPGEQMGMVRMKVGEQLGKAKVSFTATGGGHTTTSEIYIDVRSANTRTVRHYTKAIKPGDTWEQNVVPHGLAGTNEVTLEVTSVPPMDLERRLKYLIRYPHGCVEQVTSSVFPQIYLPSLTNLSDADKADIEKNVRAGIDRLRGFQIPNGGFVYWPGGWGATGANEWATNYVGHFLIEAQKAGYFVPPDMLSQWTNFQQSMAQSWAAGSERSQLQQAYRLYTLALSGQAELGAMNRMRESQGLESTARWFLAASYHLAGLTDVARELGKGGFRVMQYLTPGPTFGSELRDKAIILESLIIMEDYDRAREIVEEISDELSSGKWYSTQSVAYSLMAMSKYVGGTTGTTAFTFEGDPGTGSMEQVSSQVPVFTRQLESFPLAGANVRVHNTSDKLLTATVVAKGIPKAGEEQAASDGLAITVSYTDMDGNRVSVTELEQGTDIMAHIRVANRTGRDMDNIALTHIVPSGWEIHNTRLDSGEDDSQRTDIDYQDIRDDRIYTYFGLKAGESKDLTASFNAAYLGRYYLPGISVEAMYDATKHARTKGQWVTVIRSKR